MSKVVYLTALVEVVCLILLMFAVNWMLKYLVSVEIRYLRSQMNATAEPLVASFCVDDAVS